jgi:hypothetical protein
MATPNLRKALLSTAAITVLAAAGALSAQQGSGVEITYRGRVLMEDGSPPPKGAVIERLCSGRRNFVASADKQGNYEFTEDSTVVSRSQQSGCVWHAVLKGYDSTEIGSFDSARLPDIILKVSPPKKK